LLQCWSCIGNIRNKYSGGRRCCKRYKRIAGRNLNHSLKIYDFIRVKRDDGQDYFVLETDHLSEFEIVAIGNKSAKKFIFGTRYESTVWNWIKFIFLFGWIWMWFG